MKQRIREILINWVKVKEQFPAFNLCDDPFYHEKFQLLVEGRESLSNNSLGAFMEWSETIEIRWASKFEKGPLKPLDTFHTQLDSLSSIIYLMASKDYINDNQAATNLDVIVSGSLNALASAALDQLLRTLKRFPSADILEVLDEDLEREFGPDDMGRAELLILSLFELLEEYPDAVQSIFKGFFEPIVELSTATFSTLNVYEHYATSKAVQDAKGSQQREAANKKMNQTEELGNMPLHFITKSHGKAHAKHL